MDAIGIGRKNETDEAVLHIILNSPSQDSSCLRDSKQTQFLAERILGISQIICKVSSSFVSFFLPIPVPERKKDDVLISPMR